MINQYSLKDVAERLSLSKDTLRYYDKIGLITPERGENRYRMYTADMVNDLMYVQVMKYAGFSLFEIKHVLKNRKKYFQTKAVVCDTLDFLATKKLEILAKIDFFKNILHLLDQSIDTLQKKTNASEMDELVSSIYQSMPKGENPHV